MPSRPRYRDAGFAVGVAAVSGRAGGWRNGRDTRDWPSAAGSMTGSAPSASQGSHGMYGDEPHMPSYVDMQSEACREAPTWLSLLPPAPTFANLRVMR